MTHRGPFQPRTFCDSVITEDCQEQYGSMGGGMREKAKKTGAHCRSCLGWCYEDIVIGAPRADQADREGRRQRAAAV